jgi:hypothetical protein
MNSQRFAQSHGKAQLAFKDALLDISGRIIIVVIETYLPESNASRMFHSFKSDYEYQAEPVS